MFDKPGIVRYGLPATNDAPPPVQKPGSKRVPTATTLGWPAGWTCHKDRIVVTAYRRLGVTVYRSERREQDSQEICPQMIGKGFRFVKKIKSGCRATSLSNCTAH